MLQERQAALAAVSSQLWEGRNRAAANSPQPSAPGKATSHSPMSQGPSISGPSTGTLSAAAKHAIPAAHDTLTQDMNGGAMAQQEGKGKAGGQKSVQPQALGLEQESTSAGAFSQEDVSEGQQGSSLEGHKGPSEKKLSERESRAAARLSRLAQSTTHTGSKTSQGRKADHESQSRLNTGKGLGLSFYSFMNACMSQGMQNCKTIV